MPTSVPVNQGDWSHPAEFHIWILLSAKSEMMEGVSVSDEDENDCSSKALTVSMLEKNKSVMTFLPL
jgi:hypothetical protein